MYVVVDGSKIGQFTADTPRPDIAAAHPQAGPNHGFDTSCASRRAPTPSACGPATSAAATTCRRAASTAPSTTARSGTSTRLTARLRGDPRRGLDVRPRRADRPGHRHRHRRRQADDPDRGQAEPGRPSPTTRTSSPARSTASTPTIPISQGTHTVCVVGTNIGFGTDNTLRLPDPRPQRQPARRDRHPGRSPAPLCGVRGWTYDRDDADQGADRRDHRGRATPHGAGQPRRARTSPRPSRRRRAHGFDQTYRRRRGHPQRLRARQEHQLRLRPDARLQDGALELHPHRRAGRAHRHRDRRDDRRLGERPGHHQPDLGPDHPRRAHASARSSPTSKANDHSGHTFTLSLPSTSGRHTVCVVGINVLYGTHNSPQSCRTDHPRAGAARQVRVDRPRGRVRRPLGHRLGLRPGHPRAAHRRGDRRRRRGRPGQDQRRPARHRVDLPDDGRPAPRAARHHPGHRRRAHGLPHREERERRRRPHPRLQADHRRAPGRPERAAPSSARPASAPPPSPGARPRRTAARRGRST